MADAHVVLGYLNPVAIAGGTRRIHQELAEAAVSQLGDQLEVSAIEAAFATYSIANAQMRRAIRAVSVERGRDPRDFSLISFGGGGGIHAAALACELEMGEVIVPIVPGLFSGLGLLMSDIAVTVTASHRARLAAAGIESLREKLDDLAAEALTDLRRQRGEPEATEVTGTVEVRYVGQSSTLPLTVELAGEHDMASLARRVHEQHERVFGHALPGEPIESVSIRVRASVPMRRPAFSSIFAASYAPPDASDRQRRDVLFSIAEGRVATPIVSRAELSLDATPGPLVIEDPDTTVVVPPSFSAMLDPTGSILLHPLN